MRKILAGLAIAACGLLPPAAHAFDQCNGFYSAPNAVRDLLVDEVVRNSPMKYLEQARAIRVVTEEPSGRLIPFATLDPQGQPIVVYPSAFPPLLCRIALAVYLHLEGKEGPLEAAAREAARCVATKQPFEACLAAYARDLE